MRLILVCIILAAPLAGVYANPPGVEYSRTLTGKVQGGLQAKGEQYEPRTRHLVGRIDPSFRPEETHDDR